MVRREIRASDGVCGRLWQRCQGRAAKDGVKNELRAEAYHSVVDGIGKKRKDIGGVGAGNLRIAANLGLLNGADGVPTGRWARR